MALRGRYAMSGTEIAYAARRAVAIASVAAFALAATARTEIGYAATGTEVGYATRLPSVVCAVTAFLALAMLLATVGRLPGTHVLRHVRC
eukprot:640189-Rhodomonas_salina.1